MYEILVFEKKIDSYHKLSPQYNCEIIDSFDATNAYGWEGIESLSPIDPNLPMIFWDKLDGDDTYSILVIADPNNNITCQWNDKNKCWQTLLTPAWIKVYKDRFLNNVLPKVNPCYYRSDSDLLRCAVNPAITCKGCRQYEPAS